MSGEQPINFPDMSQYEVICATDRAYMTLKSRHIKLDFIAGDFDSLKELPKDIETIHTPNAWQQTLPYEHQTVHQTLIQQTLSNLSS